MPDGVYNPYQTVLALGQLSIPFIRPGAASTTIAVQTGSNIAAVCTTMATMPGWAASQPVYVYLAANSLASGVPATAGYYYGVLQSTSAITIYNNPYSNVAMGGTGGTPIIPAILNTWSSITNSTITPTTNSVTLAYQFQVLGGTLSGISDAIRITSTDYSFTNSTNSKSFAIYAGTNGTTGDTQVMSSSDATSGHLSWAAPVYTARNRLTTTAQVWAYDKFSSGNGGSTGGNVYTSLNTANPFYISFSLNTAAVTDFVAHEHVSIEMIRGI